ncbi:hypothetical protein WJR50_00860 [Catalinimonas sp. 4WD22]|uniref:hypothetical protein n=1 Tax=Catalinimonas locisalis TaxID=3133978 RepID=UPI003100CEAD
MNYRIVELEDLSGDQATIYSIIESDNDDTAFEQFIAEHHTAYENEILDIVNRIDSIGKVVGARDHFFKHNEGKPGDLVCALYDKPGRHLRLYCIRFGSVAIILGGGGPKNTRSWQEDEKLSQEVRKMMKVSEDIANRLRDGSLYWTEDGMELIGDLNFEDDE